MEVRMTSSLTVGTSIPPSKPPDIRAMRTVFYLIQKEILQVLRDRVMLFQIIMIPVIQLLLLTSAATFEVREAKVHLVDNDHTQASRRVAEAFRASEHFAVQEQSSDADAANQSLRARRVDLILHVPRGFEHDLHSREETPVRLVVNGIQATAGVMQSYATQILGDVVVDLGTEQPPQVHTTSAVPRQARLDVRPPSPIQPDP